MVHVSGAAAAAALQVDNVNLGRRGVPTALRVVAIQRSLLRQRCMFKLWCNLLNLPSQCTMMVTVVPAAALEDPSVMQRSGSRAESSRWPARSSTNILVLLGNSLTVLCCLFTLVRLSLV
jgi:hypothetical protein